MDFEFVIKKLLDGFKKHGIRCAAIGGYALGLWGVERATKDLDFLVHSDDSEKLHQLMTSLGYKRIFDSENVSQYQGEVFALWGYVDFLKAQRPTARKILADSAEKTAASGEWKMLAARPEDIIGLKVQAIANNPDRREKDAADIAALLEISRMEGRVVDWKKIESYYRLFSMEEQFKILKERYAAAR